jgi:hypothetical protein
MFLDHVAVASRGFYSSEDARGIALLLDPKWFSFLVDLGDFLAVEENSHVLVPRARCAVRRRRTGARSDQG